MRAALALVLVLAATGCGPAVQPPEDGTGVEQPALRLRHQIMVRYGDQLQVFEGYMILRGEAFLVKAFAGPGIDLFTVRRDGPRHAEEAHVPGLADRLDLGQVGADIARAYLPGCRVPAAEDVSECEFYGEPLVERYDDRGRLIERTFPEAHGIGLHVTYGDYAAGLGHETAGTITLSWGESGNEMVIRLLDTQPLPDFDAAALAIP